MGAAVAAYVIAVVGRGGRIKFIVIALVKLMICARCY